MPAVPVVAAVGAVVGAGAAVASSIQQSKANKAAKKQYKYERQLADNRAAKERNDAIRQARLARGAMAQTAANSGAADSSIALGALGSITSQLNRNLSFLDTNQKLANQAGYYANKATIHSNKAQLWGGISNLGFQVFGGAGGTGAFSKGST